MKLGLKFIDALSHTVLIVFVGVIISVAVSASLLRHYLPDINEYRQFILTQINAHSRGVVIDAKEIRSDWRLFRPEMSLYGVSVRSSRIDDDLYLEKLQIKIDFVKSLLRQRLYFDYIELSTLDVLLIEDERGQWSFANLQSQDREKQSLKTIFNRLWAVDGLVLQHINLALLPYGGKKIQLPGLRARISTYKEKKNFVVELMDGQKRVFQLIAMTQSQPVKKDFSLIAYVEFKDYAFTELANIFINTHSVKDGRFSNRFWISWRDNKVDFSGKAQLDNIDIQGKDTHLHADFVKADVFGGFDGDQYYVGISKTEARLGEDNFEIPKIKLTYQDDFKLFVDQLDLPIIQKIIKHGTVPETVSTLVDTLNPRGSMKNLLVAFGPDTPFLLSGNLKDVSVGAWGGAPELLSVNGFVQATKEGGYVEFDTHDFSLFFPRLYKKPMQFDKAKGYVDWSLLNNALYVTGKNIHLDAVFGQAVGDFSFSMPKVKSDSDPAKLSLAIGLKNTDAKYRSIFIPYTLSENLLKWLDVNIHEGILPEVGFIYHGPTQKDAVAKKSVQLWLKLKDAKITYADKWPAIEHIDGEFLWDDDHGYAHVDRALTDNVAIKAASFLLKPTRNGQTIEVEASANATGKQALQFLNNAALVDSLGSVLGDWDSVAGSADAQVKVSIMLGGKKINTQVDVDALLNQVDLHLPRQNIRIGNISGNLGYSSASGLHATGLTGVFLDRPLTANVISTMADGKINTSILMESNMAVNDFTKWSGLSILNFATGSALFRGEISYGSGAANLKVTSELEGVSINLPKPFRKKIEDRRKLTLYLPLKAGRKELDIVYGQGINAHFMYGEEGIEAGTINLGLNRGQYQRGKIVLGGQVVTVKIEEWQDVVNQYKQFVQSADESSRETGASSLVFLVENLQIKQLKGYGQVLDMVSFDMFNTSAYWQLGVDHKDLNATLKIYEQDQPMELGLHRVNLEFLSRKQEESGVGYGSASLSKFPDLNVTIDNLIFKGEDYGEWEFKVRSYDDRMALEDMQASFKAMRLTTSTDEGATLYWTLGDHPVTHFKGKFVSENIANVLKAWGYQQEVHSKYAEFDVESFWDGVPTDFAFNNINAKSYFKLEKGNFADVSTSSAGALKFIGVFNIANLVKRLKLDFSDLTSDGLSYDKVTGFMRSDHGVYHFDQPVTIKSSTSKIRIYGGFDMNDRQLDMTMGVTLPLASNLPWIVALAGGLPMAAGVYIISKVLDKQVDQISSAVYTVTGDFSEPKIKFDSLFDTEEAFQKERVKPENSGELPSVKALQAVPVL